MWGLLSHIEKHNRKKVFITPRAHRTMSFRLWWGYAKANTHTRAVGPGWAGRARACDAASDLGPFYFSLLYFCLFFGEKREKSELLV